MDQKKILIIDGDYVANSKLGFMNSGERSCPLNTKSEQEAFIAALSAYVYSILDRFSSHIDHVVVVSDSKSFRKDSIPHRPYYLKNDVITPIGYKANRTAKKNDSPINYDNFRKVYEEFIADLSTMIPTMKIDRLEGDDLLMLISRHLQQSNMFGIILATDGDLEQLVNRSCLYYKNISSKIAPDGEVIIDSSLYESTFQSTYEERMLNSAKHNYISQLFALSLKSQTTVKRSINQGVKLGTQLVCPFIKIICGDTKDNIFPLIRWTKGDKNFSVTEKMLEKALMNIGYGLSTKTAMKFMSGDKELVYELFLQLQIVTKQPGLDFDDLYEHFKYNYRQNVLHPSLLPMESVAMFDEIWKELKPKLTTELFDMDNVAKLNSRFDRSSDIISNSLPASW